MQIMALTAHAFLFTIALAADTAPLARYLSMIISIIITLLTCRLFIGHMIREVADRTWLEQFEKTYLPEVGQVHVKVSTNGVWCGTVRRVARLYLATLSCLLV